MYPNYYGPEYYMQAQLNQQQQQLQQLQQQQQKTVVDFVQGEASADVFPVNNGQKVILFDIDSPYVYQKERDLSGRLSKRKFRLEEETEEEPKTDLSGYVKVEDVAEMVSEAVDKKLSELNIKPTKKKEE